MASSSEPVARLCSQPFQSPPPLSSPTQPLMHKNNLQQFALRSNIGFPTYQTVSEGQPHAPRFRSTVLVGGVSYTSQTTFSQRKAAEQEAARLALESLSKKTREEGPSRVCEISAFCKSILNEYAAKLNLEKPAFNTVMRKGLLPVFTSSVVFNGMSYTGDAARSKKEAEQKAARAAILSILGNSDSDTRLIEMLNSKFKLYDAFIGNDLQCIIASAVSASTNTGHTSIEPTNKDTAVIEGSVANINNETRDKFLESSVVHSTCQDVIKGKGLHDIAASDVSPTANAGHISVEHSGVAVPVAANNNETETSKFSNVSLQSGSAHSVGDSSSSKKRRKNKKKANKKSRLESPLPISAAFPMNQSPPCSMAG